MIVVDVLLTSAAMLLTWSFHNAIDSLYIAVIYDTIVQAAQQLQW